MANVMENDDEINGQDNVYTTYFRAYDARLGRWFSTDPGTQPWQSPYCAMDNNPIALNDPNGDCTNGSDCSSVPSTFLDRFGADFGSFGNGIADGFIGALPDIVGFTWDMLTDRGARQEFMIGMKTIMANPLDALKAIAGEKLELYTAILNGEGTEEQKYEVGKEIGNMLFGLATGSVASKFINLIKIARFEKKLVKIAKESEDAVIDAKNAQDFGKKSHKIMDDIYSRQGKGEQGYLNGDAVDGYRKKGTSNPDVRYSKNKNKPKIAYDYKTSGSMAKVQLEKYLKNLPKGTIIKEVSKDPLGNYRVKTVGKVK